MKKVVEKVIWAKKLNKPLNMMFLRKQTFSVDTVKAGIAKAKKIYSKSKHLDVAYRQHERGTRYSFTVRAFY